MQDLEELKKDILDQKKRMLFDVFVTSFENINCLIARCESAEKNQKVDVMNLIADYEDASEEHGWEFPHPIFKMAEELDFLRAERNVWTEKLNSLRLQAKDFALINTELRAELKELREQKPVAEDLLKRAFSLGEQAGIYGESDQPGLYNRAKKYEEDFKKLLDSVAQSRDS
jgi:ribosome modulation factor